jgi:hypothetical protein
VVSADASAGHHAPAAECAAAFALRATYDDDFITGAQIGVVGIFGECDILAGFDMGSLCVGRVYRAGAAAVRLIADDTFGHHQVAITGELGAHFHAFGNGDIAFCAHAKTGTDRTVDLDIARKLDVANVEVDVA